MISRNIARMSCPSSKGSADIAVSICMAVFLSVLAGLLSYFTYWQCDAVYYQYFVPLEYGLNDQAHQFRITGFWEIFASQANHYMIWNGRFWVHCLVQLYCGLIGSHLVWAISNGLVWMLLTATAMKYGGFSWRRPNEAFYVCVSLLLVYTPMWMDPAFQINYVWVCVVNLLWILCFFKQNVPNREKWYGYLVLIFLSLFAGSGNEAYSFPIGIGAAAYFIASGLRLSRRQWIMATTYAVGAIAMAAAPGNRVRLQFADEITAPYALALKAALPLLMLMAILCVVAVVIGFRQYGVKQYLKRNIFALGCVAGILVLVFAIPAAAARSSLFGFFCVGILIKHSAPEFFSRKIILAILGVASCMYIWWKADETLHARELFSYREECAVRTSVTDSLLKCRIGDFDRHYYFDLRDFDPGRRSINPSAPDLKIRAFELDGIKEDADTNMLLPLSNGRWICVQSKLHPAEFVVNRSVVLGPFSKEIEPRELKFHNRSSIYIYETSGYTVGLYVPNRLINADVSMICSKD